ncbi:MAG: hypothetical protein ACREDL_04260 [Bradyrhizobium sp.]
MPGQVWVFSVALPGAVERCHQATEVLGHQLLPKNRVRPCACQIFVGYQVTHVFRPKMLAAYDSATELSAGYRIPKPCRAG